MEEGKGVKDEGGGGGGEQVESYTPRVQDGMLMHNAEERVEGGKEENKEG